MRELVLHCLEAQAEALSDALLEAGVLSVSVEDADFGTDDERPLFGEPGTEPDVQAWDRNRVVALLPTAPTLPRSWQRRPRPASWTPRCSRIGACATCRTPTGCG